jgi:hypothetical protein
MERDFELACSRSAIDQNIGLNNSHIRHVRFVPNFSREPPFFLCKLSYVRDSPPERSDRSISELAWTAAAVSYFKIAI